MIEALSSDDQKPPPHRQEALVVFSGESEIWWLRWLKKGFRHCFVLLRETDGWVFYDPLSHFTRVAFIPVAIDSPVGGPANWYQDAGYRVLPVTIIEPARKMAPLALFSCVEAVKRVLGIRAWYVVTPSQLYFFLKNRKKGIDK